jgi:hypothetical protein
MRLTWRDAGRRLSLRLESGTSIFPAAPRRVNVRVAGSTIVRSIELTERPIDLTL